MGKNTTSTFFDLNSGSESENGSETCNITTFCLKHSDDRICLTYTPSFRRCKNSFCFFSRFKEIKEQCKTLFTTEDVKKRN